jgi:hypothetical protein
MADVLEYECVDRLLPVRLTKTARVELMRQIGSLCDIIQAVGTPMQIRRMRDAGGDFAGFNLLEECARYRDILKGIVSEIVIMDDSLTDIEGVGNNV